MLTYDLAQAAKTRYDRMFQRKNQNILSEHYNKLVDRDEDKEDDFITLKRADHGLGADDGDESHLSNRKLKAGQSRKKMAAAKGSGNKLVFDEEGGAHPLYEMENEEDFVAAGGAREQGQKFVEAEREVMKARDLVDKERVKERKREKKRKRKEVESVCFTNSSSDMQLTGFARVRTRLLLSVVTMMTTVMPHLRSICLQMPKRTELQKRKLLLCTSPRRQRRAAVKGRTWKHWLSLL